MINIRHQYQALTDTAAEQHWPIFRLAFRPLFLLGALFGIVSLTLWVFMLSVHPLEVYGGGLWWHTHEMLFGFAVAIISGFLLTAVQNWTQIPSVKGWPLAIMVMVWLLARISFFLPTVIPPIVIAIVDIAYLPIVAFWMAKLIIKAKLWRNIVFVPLLLLMTILNICMHACVLLQHMKWVIPITNTMVFAITLLMVIMAGRIFPMFTANGTLTKRVENIPTLEILSIVSMALVLITQSQWFSLNMWFDVSLPLVAMLIHAYRAIRWRPWVCVKTPLVWSLHLSYWFIPLGLLLLAISQFVPQVSHSQALHSFTIGGIGLMILSMISRVSLGHTGNKIIVGKTVSIAFLLLVASFLCRFIAPWLAGYYFVGLVGAVSCWVGAYGVFVVLYAGKLTKARDDGRPG